MRGYERTDKVIRKAVLLLKKVLNLALFHDVQFGSHGYLFVHQLLLLDRSE